MQLPERLQNDEYEKTRDLIDRLLMGVRDVDGLDAIEKAVTLMIDLHVDQADRPDGSPYINHPLDVAIQVVEDLRCNRRDVIIAALLHDSVEDQAERLGGTHAAALATIADRFGERVSELVGHLTNPDFAEMASKRWPNAAFTKVRKNQLYLEHFRHIAEANPDAFAIKMCDFGCNGLRLNQVSDPAKKQKLQAKYGPVVQFLVKELATIQDPEHPVYASREQLLERVTTAWREQYDRQP